METQSTARMKAQDRIDGGRSLGGVSSPTSSGGARRFGDPGAAEEMTRLATPLVLEAKLELQ